MNVRDSISALALISLLACVHCGVRALREYPQEARCPQLLPGHLELDIIQGRWFVARMSSTMTEFDPHVTCLFSDVSLLVNAEGWDIKLMTTACTGRSCLKTSMSAKRMPQQFAFRGAFLSQLEDMQTPLEPNFFIMHQDEHFAVIYICQADHFNNALEEKAFILSRERYPNLSALEKLELKLSLNGIHRLRMMNVPQNICPLSVEKKYSHEFDSFPGLPR